MYATMYKKMCATPTKINIYDNPDYVPLPAIETKIPMTVPLYKPIQPCGEPYQTPMYHPPNCGCSHCKK